MTTTSAVQQTKQVESTLTLAGKPIDHAHRVATEILIPADRCERCRAQAFVRAVKKSNPDLTWLFCGYHGRLNLESLISQGYAIDDQTHNIS